MFGNALGISTILCWPFLVFFMGVRVAVLEVGEMTNYGIKSTLANASRAGLGMYACAVPLVLLVTYVLWLRNVPLFQLIDFGWFWTIAALAVAFAYGGVDVINHYVLRLIVYRNGYVPKGLHGFLDHCTKLVFLRRVGGGYIFIHRLLLEHFAAMWEVERKQKGSKAPFAAGSALPAPS